MFFLKADETMLSRYFLMVLSCLALVLAMFLVGCAELSSGSGSVGLSPAADNLSDTDNRLLDQSMYWQSKASAAVINKDWLEVIRTTTVAIKLNPALTAPYLDRSLAYINKRYYKKAMEDANLVLQSGPNNAIALNNRGVAGMALKQRTSALEDYLKACKYGYRLACQNYKNIVGWYPKENQQRQLRRLLKMSREQFAAGDFKDVVAVSSEIIGMDSKNVEAYSNRCAAYANQKQYDLALSDCEIALVVNPDFAMIYNNLGFVYEKLEKQKDALLQYEIGCSLKNELACINLKRLR